MRFGSLQFFSSRTVVAKGGENQNFSDDGSGNAIVLAPGNAEHDCPRRSGREAWWDGGEERQEAQEKEE